MKFEELVKKLNEKIVNEGKDDKKAFKDKQDLKSWLCGAVVEIVGENFMKRRGCDGNDKYDIDYTYNGKDNYVTIQYNGAYVGDIKFKYTYYSEYNFCWTYTYYGIKEVSFEKYSEIKADNFEECKQEVIQLIKNRRNEHEEYVTKYLLEYKEFVEKLESIGMNYLDIKDKMDELRYFYKNLNHTERDKFNKAVFKKDDIDAWYYL